MPSVVPARCQQSGGTKKNLIQSASSESWRSSAEADREGHGWLSRSDIAEVAVGGAGRQQGFQAGLSFSSCEKREFWNQTGPGLSPKSTTSKFGNFH